MGSTPPVDTAIRSGRMRGASGLTGRDRMLVLAVPLMLVLIAALAIVRYHRVDQSPWHGIGFGMFSTYEYPLARSIRATSHLEGEAERVPVPQDLERLASRVRVAPGDPETEQLARALLERTGADRIVVEVWGHDVESDDGLEIGFRVLERVAVP